MATLDALQQSVFDALEYTELAIDLKIPLINLHTGEMITVKTPDGFVFKEISLHRTLADTDLLCSVPMMKTHGLATVTLKGEMGPSLKFVPLNLILFLLAFLYNFIIFGNNNPASHHNLVNSFGLIFHISGCTVGFVAARIRQN